MAASTISSSASSSVTTSEGCSCSEGRPRVAKTGVAAPTTVGVYAAVEDERDARRYFLPSSPPSSSSLSSALAAAPALPLIC